MRSFKILNKDLYIFEDLYKGESRLNVVAHGSEDGMFFSGRNFTAEDLADYLVGNDVNFENYKNIRLLSCFSGSEAKGVSFAKQFANITRKPVKGYVGTMTGNFPTEGVAELIRDAVSKGFDINIGSAIFDGRHAFRVDKVNPYKFYDVFNWLSFEYRPVKHFPD
ncbi:hypothetical protein [Burkholderia ubonensis]|uniref:hypothetical protein n=1 Tax=Burkholderia ubonensis TaxID=101571 RepID=UPI0012FB06E6|nr:hypothetical protein [Burkholderia ubonensis]